MKNDNKKIFVCSECGNEFGKWQGKCSYCNSWDSLREINVASNVIEKTNSASERPVTLDKVKDINIEHISTGSSEFDRALSGGLVAGSITLIGGDPGIGKSTLMLQICHSIVNSLYVSGEESVGQIYMRAKRLDLNISRIKVLIETEVENIIKQILIEKPRLVVIDSIQTMYSSLIASAPSSIVQLRQSTMLFQQLAKKTDIPIILVGHVTKEGIVAGPKILEHIVDSVCYLEGNQDDNIRFIKTIKHRFGSVNEIGIFEMKESGLKSLANPSEKFISSRAENAAGSVISSVMEGNRPLLVEVQALVSKNFSNFSRRICSGISQKRLDILIAIIERNAGIKLYDHDVFVNLTGGLVHHGSDIDLAVCAAILSSYYKKPVPQDWCIWGEVGLTGEIRKVQRSSVREKESSRQGYQILKTEKLKDLITKIKTI